MRYTDPPLGGFMRQSAHTLEYNSAGLCQACQTQVSFIIWTCVLGFIIRGRKQGIDRLQCWVFNYMLYS